MRSEDAATTRIPLSEPRFDGREAEYLQACIDERWVAGNGRFVREFEERFAALHGRPGAVAVSSGTAALHLALADLGVGPGDEVICPALTFVASASPIHVVGATPVLVDVDPETFTLDPAALEAAITERTRAVVVVHLFGHPAEMDAISAIAARHGLAVIEDATEALSSRHQGRLCGTLGDAGCFSFNGNKVITSGGGGMVLARDDARLEHIRHLHKHARVPGTTEYLHDEVGFNYALSNLQAAVGLAQFESLDGRLADRRRLAARYAELLDGAEGLRFTIEAPWATHNFWLMTVVVDPARRGRGRTELLRALNDQGIEARPFFTPLNRLAPYAGGAATPVADHLHEHGICLPSSAQLTDDEQQRVVDVLRA